MHERLAMTAQSEDVAAASTPARSQSRTEGPREDERFEFRDLRILPPDEASPAAPKAAPLSCDSLIEFHKVTSGKFEGGKTLDDYYPAWVGKDAWGAKDTAGPFDTGKRAGSALQFVGTYPMLCPHGGTVFPTAQTARIRRARANGVKGTEDGKDLEGQTIDDVKHSGQDQSKAPFRQTWKWAVSFADPISGIEYKDLDSYELHVDLTSSLSGPGSTSSVTWGVRVEAKAGKVTRNDLI